MTSDLRILARKMLYQRFDAIQMRLFLFFINYEKILKKNGSIFMISKKIGYLIWRTIPHG